MTDRSGFRDEQAASDLEAARRRLDAVEAELEQARRVIAGLTAATAATARLEMIERDLATARARLDEVTQRSIALEEMDAQITRWRAAAAKAGDRFDRARDELRQLRRDLGRERRRYERLRGRLSVRIALRLARLGARRRRAPIATRPPDSGRDQAAPPRRAAHNLADVVREARAAPSATSGPMVSIVVLTRDGEHHLRRLFAGLRDRTSYRSFEVIVVDNASSDGTAAVFDEPWGFPLRVLRNQRNVSFSEGNNQALEHATGDLVLLLNNDVDPINPGWLGAMVETLMASRARAAVGALLIYPDREDDERSSKPGKSRAVQHRGIGFTFVNGAPRARNLGQGEDPRAPELLGSVRVPAATAACLLVRKDDLVAVGGLSAGYVYGTEDVDLCLALAASGKEIWYCGNAALFHHESATQNLDDRSVVRQNRERNWSLFAARWGPALSRSLRRDQLTGAGVWTGHPGRTVAITVTSTDPAADWGDLHRADALARAFEREGWRAILIESQARRWYKVTERVDLCVSMHDQFDVRSGPPAAYHLAWIGEWTDRWLARPWLDAYDLVLASSAATSAIVALASEQTPPVLPPATDPEHFAPGDSSPELRCDIVFAGDRRADVEAVLSPLGALDGLVVAGRGWDASGTLASRARGPIHPDRLRDLYRSAKLVVDHAPPHLAAYGALDASVLDALAAGALVLTNNLTVSYELFDGQLPVYVSSDDLRDVIERYLGDEDLRAKTVDGLRRTVLERHTWQRRASEIVALALEQVERPKVRVRNPAPTRLVSESWGDTHLARAFTRGLRALGFATAIDLQQAWDDPACQDGDVVVCLRGLHAYRPKHGALNALWLISHPDLVGSAEIDAYDHVFVASARYAEHLRSIITRPVDVLWQATDTNQFKPVPAQPDLHAGVLFVGSARGEGRQAVTWALECGARLSVYGKRWESLLPDGVLRDVYFPNDRLRDLYCSADVVLGDHWGDMAGNGFVSNRTFDVLACGAFLISDYVEGIEELFGDLVPTFRSRDELCVLLSTYGDDEPARRRLADAGMTIVREAHSFEARARQFVDAISPALAARPRTIEGMASRPRGSD